MFQRLVNINFHTAFAAFSGLYLLSSFQQIYVPETASYPEAVSIFQGRVTVK